MFQILSQIILNRVNKIIHSRKELKDFAEGSKILLDTNKKINFVELLNIYVERSN